jgi:hypothetical protein
MCINTWEVWLYHLHNIISAFEVHHVCDLVHFVYVHVLQMYMYVLGNVICHLQYIANTLESIVYMTMYCLCMSTYYKYTHMYLRAYYVISIHTFETSVMYLAMGIVCMSMYCGCTCFLLNMIIYICTLEIHMIFDLVHSMHVYVHFNILYIHGPMYYKIFSLVSKCVYILMF